MPEACATCIFWNKLEPGHTFADCRRQPPQFELSITVKRDRYRECDEITVSRFPHARWPNTAETDWCGEYRMAAGRPPGEEPAHV